MKPALTITLRAITCVILSHADQPLDNQLGVLN